MLYDVHDVYPSYSITKNQYLILRFMSHSMWRTLFHDFDYIYICCCLFDWQTSSEWPLLDHMANGPSLTLSWSINIGKNTKDMKIWGKYQIAKVKWGCRFKYHGPKQEVSAQLHMLRYLFMVDRLIRRLISPPNRHAPSWNLAESVPRSEQWLLPALQPRAV